MGKIIKLRLVGAAILLFNLWMVGRFNMHGPAVAVLTIGFVIAYERFIVRPAKNEMPQSNIDSAQLDSHRNQNTQRTEDRAEEGEASSSPLPSIGGVVFVCCVMIGIVALLFLAASSPR